MSEGAAESCPSPSSGLSPDPSLDGLPTAEAMPGARAEDGGEGTIVGLAIPCCVCLEAERLRGCLNSEKICIVPILACLVSLCLCIAGLKWVFVDKIFEYDTPTHLDPGRIGQDPITAVDPTAASATWDPSEVYPSPSFPGAHREAKGQVQGVTVQGGSSRVPSDPLALPSPQNPSFPFSLLPSAASSFPPPTQDSEGRAPMTASQPPTSETNLQSATKVSTSTSTAGTSHLVKCAEKDKTFCVNGGECFIVKDPSNPSRYSCKCPNEFTGDRCQNYVMASFYSTSTPFLSLPE
ncbi:pro-neuregulin-1, membrane-bound isoform isoform X6 [Notamacropus eugenii]|uniref:pro-neuregulin-1, membrane-bound isoform isoform X6 n=1 Tax=Notamacropus eugenii TaxID=9315 RepID=UPI003B66F2A0